MHRATLIDGIIPTAMDPVFNERKMRAWLSPLNHRARVAFVLSCCERTLPHLVAFGEEAGDCSPAELRAILDAAWWYLNGKDLDDEIPALIDAAKRAAPASPEGSSIHSGPAVNAGFAVVLLLETIANGALDKVIEAAAVANDSAESYAQADLQLTEGTPDAEAQILAHPLVQAELKRQREDIKLLRRTSMDRPESVAALREQWSEDLL